MQRFAVIGLGRFGQRLARALAATQAEVIAIDRDGRLVEQVRDDVTLAVRLDSTDAEALKAQGVPEVDVAIVGIGEHFEAAALTVATLKELGVKHIIARAQSDIQGSILKKVGADAIAQPETESAMRWAHRLMLPNLQQYVELDDRHSMIYTTAPRQFHDKTLKELDMRNQYGVNLIAIERKVGAEAKSKEPAITKPWMVVPNANTTILPDDVLVLVGSNESLSNLPGD